MTIEDRMVAGKILEGFDAQAVRRDVGTTRFWIRIAIAYIDRGFIEGAKSVLLGLLEQEHYADVHEE